MAKLSTLTDDFATLSEEKWSFWSDGAPPAVVDGQLTIMPTTGYSYVTSVDQYDLTSSEFVIEVIRPALGPEGVECAVYADQGGTTRLGWRVTEGRLHSYSLSGGSDTSTNIAYSGTNHRWLKVALAGTTATWSASPDGITWSTIASRTVAGTYTAVNMRITSGIWNEATPAASLVVDNLNLPPAAGAVAKVWDGSTWQTGAFKYWNGPTWQSNGKVWDGAAWPPIA